MSGFSFSEQQLADLASQVLDQARQQGASDCDVEISESFGQNVTVRLGDVETIEYNRDKGMGVTVYVGKQKKGHASTSDFTASALADTVGAAWPLHALPPPMNTRACRSVSAWPRIFLILICTIRGICRLKGR